MVLDNADDKDVFFNQQTTPMSQSSDAKSSTVPLVTYLPQTARGGSILITSRNRDAAFRLTNSAANLIDVPFMNKEDAVTLLCKKLPEDHSSDDERLELVELLEYLPLAITQAAAYISVKRTRMTIAGYSKFLRKSESILLDDMGDLRRDPTIPSSVLLTWQISFDQINGENRAAAELLSLMSVFDRQGIPQFLLQGENEDDLQFERRLAPLEEFGLITLEGGGRSFQIHRLVQIAIRSWLEQHREIDRWKQYAAELLEKVVRRDDYRSPKSWKTWEILLPHSEVVVDYVSHNPNGQQLYASILSKTARYLIERGKYAAARKICQRALEIHITLFGEGDIAVARSILLLAILNQSDRAAELNEIEAMRRRALAIFVRVQGKDSEESKSARSDLGLALLETDNEKKIEEATEIFRSILESQEQNIGLDHPGTLVTKNHLALSLCYQGNYNDAEPLFRQTLDARLRVLGEDDPHTISSMQSLASCLIGKASFEEAEEFAQRALELRKLILGEEHPHTLHTVRALTVILQRQNRYAEAEESCRHSLSIHTRVLGPDHYETVFDMANLARILHAQGKNAQAEAFFRKVYSRRPDSWSDSGWSWFLRDFPDTLAELGKHDEAADISRQRIHSADSNPDTSELNAE